MTDQVASDGTRTWKGATALAGLLALAAAVWGWTQYSQVQQLASRVASLEGALQSARDAIQEASKRDLPVTVTFRRALLGTGLVATFRNISSNDLEIAVLFTSPETGLEKRANLVISANGVQEIGSLEGWAFAVGHVIELTSSKYRPMQHKVPAS